MKGMMVAMAPAAAAAAGVAMNFGPPISMESGGKTSNTLSLYPKGFA